MQLPKNRRTESFHIGESINVCLFAKSRSVSLLAYIVIIFDVLSSIVRVSDMVSAIRRLDSLSVYSVIVFCFIISSCFKSGRVGRFDRTRFANQLVQFTKYFLAI
jgi:hypothetical protein